MFSTVYEYVCRQKNKQMRKNVYQMYIWYIHILDIYAHIFIYAYRWDMMSELCTHRKSCRYQSIHVSHKYTRTLVYTYMYIYINVCMHVCVLVLSCLSCCWSNKAETAIKYRQQNLHTKISVYVCVFLWRFFCFTFFVVGLINKSLGQTSRGKKSVEKPIV